MECKYCGCTDEKACPGGCYWVKPNVCSRCKERAIEILDLKQWLKLVNLKLQWINHRLCTEHSYYKRMGHTKKPKEPEPTLQDLNHSLTIEGLTALKKMLEILIKDNQPGWKA